jgi:hypothetical protein
MEILKQEDVHEFDNNLNDRHPVSKKKKKKKNREWGYSCVVELLPSLREAWIPSSTANTRHSGAHLYLQHLGSSGRKIRVIRGYM